MKIPNVRRLTRSFVASRERVRRLPNLALLRARDRFERAPRVPAAPTSSAPAGIPPQYPMPAVPAPAYQPDKAGRVVNELYRALLGREPDPEGLEAYRGHLEQGGLSRAVSGVVTSPEFQTRTAGQSVDELSLELYRVFLGRDPDPDGEAATQAAIRSGILAHRVFDMVTSPEYAQKPEAAAPGPGTPPARRTGPVRIEGRTLRDDQGPFNALGATLMSAAWMYQHDRPKLDRTLELLKNQGFDYIRALGAVGDPNRPDYWDGREIDWRDPNYRDAIAGLTDLAYDKYGLRIQWTLIGDGQKNIPRREDRFGLADTFLEMSRGREHKILAFEVANESWQNGFGGDEGIRQLRDLSRHLKDRTDVLVAASAPPTTDPEEVRKIYRDGVADFATIHFDRDTGKTDGAWRPVRQPWEYAYIAGVPGVASNNEPIGPGSSVASETDRAKLVAAAMVTHIAGLPMYVFHTRAGVRGDQEMADMAGVDAVRRAKELLPPDVANWSRKNAHWADSPFRVYARDDRGNLHGDRMWPDLPGGTGAVRAYGAVNGSDFVVLPIGVKESVVMEPRRDAEFEVVDPMTGQVVDRKRLRAGERFELGGREFFLLRGRYV